MMVVMSSRPHVDDSYDNRLVAEAAKVALGVVAR
jgi:hypothetical protein